MQVRVGEALKIRIILEFKNFKAKRKEMSMYPDERITIGHAVTRDIEICCWDDFTVEDEIKEFM